MAPLNSIVPPGVVTGDDLVKLLTHAKDNGYAIPAFNCTRFVFARRTCVVAPLYVRISPFLMFLYTLLPLVFVACLHGSLDA